MSRGSGLLALLLWFFFLVPGLIYTIWMMEGSNQFCPQCGSKDSMIPLSSPEGNRLIDNVSQLPEGWYGDPARKYDWRYWDGQAWTNRVWIAGKETEHKLKVRSRKRHQISNGGSS